MSRYDNIPVSKKTRSGMSLTSDDIQFLKRMFDRQDKIIEDMIKNHKVENCPFADRINELESKVA